MTSNFREADKCDHSEAEICVKGCDCKVEVENLCVHEPTMAHIRGRVCNQCGKPAKFVCVSLVKECDKFCRVIAMTRTDCEGRYEFHVCVSGCGDKFKVVAHGKKNCKDECEHDKDCKCEHDKKHDRRDCDRDKDRCDWGCDRDKKRHDRDCDRDKDRHDWDCDRDKKRHDRDCDRDKDRHDWDCDRDKDRHDRDRDHKNKHGKWDCECGFDHDKDRCDRCEFCGC